MPDLRLVPRLPAIDSLVFDLDGTLWDTCQTCARAWNIALERHDIRFRTIVADDVRRVTGQPHDLCIRETFQGLGERELQLLIDETTLEDNRMVELYGGTLYEGVQAGLIELSRSLPLFIVSNCQAGYIELFLKHSGLAAQFRDSECWGNTGRTKADNLAAVIARNQLQNTWFVGDTPGDAQAALACGVPFVHAAYGFGEVESAILRLREFGDLPRALS
jgi:phosphoglycolate phosphatase